MAVDSWNESATPDERSRVAARGNAPTWAWRSVLLILVAGIVWNLLLIAIPGFYSHDELDWQNRIGRGDQPWALGLGSFSDSPFFRLVGTILISASLRLPLQPLGAHLAEVFLSVVTACLLYGAVSLFRPERALAAALLFIAMPGFAFSAGWVAAGFDVLFTFFGVLSVLCAVLYWRGGSRVFLALSMASFAAALGCKETALSIPICAALVMVVDRDRIDPRRGGIVVAVAAAIVFAYLGLSATRVLKMSATGAGGYKFGTALNFAGNMFPYFGFPFATWMMEVDWFTILSPRGWIGFAAPHCVLAGLVLWRGGPKWLILYLIAFYATLLPVLPISKYETQYLYASSIALAIALAMVWDRRALVAIPVAALSLMLVVHNLRLQVFLYRTGACQTRALETLRDVLPETRPGDPLTVLIPIDMAGLVLARAVNENAFPLRGGWAKVSATEDPAKATMAIDTDCRVTIKPAP